MYSTGLPKCRRQDGGGLGEGQRFRAGDVQRASAQGRIEQGPGRNGGDVSSVDPGDALARGGEGQPAGADVIEHESLVGEDLGEPPRTQDRPRATTLQHRSLDARSPVVRPEVAAVELREQDDVGVRRRLGDQLADELGCVGPVRAHDEDGIDAVSSGHPARRVVPREAHRRDTGHVDRSRIGTAAANVDARLIREQVRQGSSGLGADAGDEHVGHESLLRLGARDLTGPSDLLDCIKHLHRTTSASSNQVTC